MKNLGLIDSNESILTTEYIVGTQSSSTNAWTGVCKQINALFDGLTIQYYLPYAGTSSSATLNLTLADGSTTGAKPVYRGNSASGRVTTHFPAGMVITLIYRNTGSYIGWQTTAYYDSTDIQTLRAYYARYYTGENPLYSYKICGVDGQGRIQPLTLESGTGTSKTVNTVAIQPDKFFHYPTTTTVSANSIIEHGLLYFAVGFANCNYTFNSSIDAYKNVYLKGLYDKNTGLFTLDNTTSTSWYVQVPNNTNFNYSDYFVIDYQYIFLGTGYSTANYMYLFPEHLMYEYNGTNLIEYSINNSAVIGVKGDNEISYRTGNVNITKSNIGLSNVDNTSDINKVVGGLSVEGGNEINFIKQSPTGGKAYLNFRGLSEGIEYSLYDGTQNLAKMTLNTLSATDFVDFRQAAGLSYLQNLSQDNRTTGFCKIKINKNANWMLAFTIRVYQYYKWFDLVVSGYNYAENHWYLPKVKGFGETGNISVYFGYDAIGELWIAFPINSYSTITICNVANGYENILSVKNLFTLTHEETLTGTIQTTVALNAECRMRVSGTTVYIRNDGIDP